MFNHAIGNDVIRNDEDNPHFRKKTNQSVKKSSIGRVDNSLKDIQERYFFKKHLGSQSKYLNMII